MAIKAVLRNSYRKPDGKKVWTYGVMGSPAELLAYEKAQGDNFRKDEETDVPLFFQSDKDPQGRPILLKAQLLLIITRNGKVVVDNSKELVALNARAESLMADKLAERHVAAMFEDVTPVSRVTGGAPVKQLQDANEIIEGAGVQELGKVGERAGIEDLTN